MQLVLAIRRGAVLVAHVLASAPAVALQALGVRRVLVSFARLVALNALVRSRARRWPPALGAGWWRRLRRPGLRRKSFHDGFERRAVFPYVMSRI